MQKGGAFLRVLKEERSLAWWGQFDPDRLRGRVLIGPDPENMRLAYKADEVLQERVPKHRIKFLHVLHPKVREAIKKRESAGGSRRCRRLANR